MNNIIELWNEQYSVFFQEYVETVSNPERFHVEWDLHGEKIVQDKMVKWLKQESEALGGEAPLSLIARGTVERPIETFKELYFGIDMDLPSCVIDLFDGSRDAFFEIFTRDIKAINDEIELEELDMAINLLTETKDERVLPMLCEAIDTCTEDVLRQWLCEAYLSFGARGRAVLKQYLLKGFSEAVGRVELLSILAYLFKGDTDDDVWQLVRAYFKRAANKQIPTACIRDLGNPKAIPLLKAYIDKTPNVPKEERRDIVATLKDLGADVSEYIE